MFPEFVRSYLRIERALPDWASRHFQLGWSDSRSSIVIPIEGRMRYRSLLTYDSQTGATTHGPSKMSWDSKGGPTPPFPSWNDWNDPDCEVIVEGEFDCMVCIAHGILAVSGTLGAGSFSQAWLEKLAGQKRVILYDADEPGRRGAERLANALLEVGCAVRIAFWGDKPNGWDATDHFRTGGTGEELRELLANAVPYTAFDPDTLPLAVGEHIPGSVPMRGALGGFQV